MLFVRVAAFSFIWFLRKGSESKEIEIAGRTRTLTIGLVESSLSRSTSAVAVLALVSAFS